MNHRSRLDEFFLKYWNYIVDSPFLSFLSINVKSGIKLSTQKQPPLNTGPDFMVQQFVKNRALAAAAAAAAAVLK
ncbi:hypothetical protein QYF36_000679 [Acer negundo]|nr:hypothetical protein QYF36_000679 [Acer negundo]